MLRNNPVSSQHIKGGQVSIQKKITHLVREVQRLSKLSHSLSLPKRKLVWRKKENIKCLLSISIIESLDVKCFVAFTALSNHKPKSWYFDSGCSRHMTGDRSCFSAISIENVSGMVTFRDGRKSKILGKGHI